MSSLLLFRLAQVLAGWGGEEGCGSSWLGVR